MRRIDAEARRKQLALVHPRASKQPDGLTAPAARIGVVIADGLTLVRAGFRALLDAQPDVVVLGEAADCDEAAAVVRRTRPGVLLIDSSLPGLEGVQAIERIAAEPGLDGVQILVLSSGESDETDESVFGALRAGVGGFLLKTTGPADLVDAVRTVAAGQGVLSPSIVRRLMDAFAALPASIPHNPAELSELTPREVEIVALVGSGMSNHEIADYLVISPTTVKTHVSRALCKLTVRDRAQLVALAYETGLVVPQPLKRSRAGAPALLAA